MGTRDFLLNRIHQFCLSSGRSERWLGQKAVGNPKIIQRIRRGDHVTTDTIERIERAMAEEADAVQAVA